jgi:hypothetical protein
MPVSIRLIFPIIPPVSAHPQMANLTDFSVSLKKVILEILKCIPAVKILVFLELEQIFSFVDGHWIMIAAIRSSPAL